MYRFKIAVIVIVIAVGIIPAAVAAAIDVDKLADAIYSAEGGPKASHAYGVLQHYKVTTPRQACINTINSAIKRFAQQSKETDFVHFLSLTYCPIGCDNDNGTNQYWKQNVKYFLLTN